jgi:hypothetical protein
MGGEGDAMMEIKEPRCLSTRYCSIGPAAALMIGGGISAGGSILSGMFGSSGAKKQAAALRYQADKAQETAYEIDRRQRADMAPFVGYGTKAGDTLMGMLDGSQDVSSTLKASPLFQWQEQEGTRMLNRQLSARGAWNSGAGMETLARFSNQLVAEEGQRFYDRLFNLTTLGSNAAARTATNTASIGGQLMQTQGQLGMAEAGAIGQQYGAWANTAQSIGSLGQTVAGLPLYNASLNYLNRQAGPVQSMAPQAQPTTTSLSIPGV